MIFGRSSNWDDEEKKAYRIIDSSYNNLLIMTYDHVLDRAKIILKRLSSEADVFSESDEEMPF